MKMPNDDSKEFFCVSVMENIIEDVVGEFFLKSHLAYPFKASPLLNEDRDDDKYRECVKVLDVTP